MVRKAIEWIGLKLQEVSLGHVYAGMGAAYAGVAIIIFWGGEAQSIPDLVANRSSWIALAASAVVFVVMGIVLQALLSLLGKLLRSLSVWYPNWYYFPRIELTPDITPQNQIELTLANPSSRHTLALQAVFANLKSHVRPLPGLSMGVAPEANRTIFPMDKMPPRSQRKRTIGAVGDGKVFLTMGTKAQESMELSIPGVYTYSVTVSGTFRQRPFKGGCAFNIVIHADGRVTVRD